MAWTFAIKKLIFMLSFYIWYRLLNSDINQSCGNLVIYRRAITDSLTNPSRNPGRIWDRFWDPHIIPDPSTRNLRGIHFENSLPRIHLDKTFGVLEKSDGSMDCQIASHSHSISVCFSWFKPLDAFLGSKYVIVRRNKVNNLKAILLRVINVHFITLQEEL